MRRFVVLGAILLLSIGGVGCQQRTEKGVAVNKGSGSAHKKSLECGSIVDKPLAAYQTELLDLAFDAASAMPLEPHIKDRSKAQASVIEAWLKLDQPQKVLSHLDEISDWRRGDGYAMLAFYLAQHEGDRAQVEQFLNKALEISKIADQDWRRERIMVKVAQTYVILGQEDNARQITEVIQEESEIGKIAGTAARRTSVESFDEELKAFDKLIATGSFDTIKNVLESATELYNRFYDDGKRRDQVEERIRANWQQLPLFIRIDLLIKMADYSLGHSDTPKALVLINEAQVLADGVTWPPEYHAPVVAKLAGARIRAGETKRAKDDLAKAVTLFESQKENIFSMFRADALRPVAEIYQLCGETSAALDIYKKVVEEGSVNPNARPRAEDLVATCVSMAVVGLEPDTALWERLRQIRSGLNNPW